MSSKGIEGLAGPVHFCRAAKREINAGSLAHIAPAIYLRKRDFVNQPDTVLNGRRFLSCIYLSSGTVTVSSSASYDYVNGNSVHEPKAGHDDAWGGLMRLALAGDQNAYRTLLAELAPYIRATVRSILARSSRGQSETEDIVQETLLAVHLKRMTWDPSLPLRPWLNAVTRHKTIDMLRRLGARSEVDIELVSDIAAVQEDCGEHQIDTHRMLNVLDGRQRQIVEQVSLGGHSAADVGEKLGMSEGAIRVALHRALKKLALTFRERDDAN